MKYDDPKLRNLLAGEYVLGTLRGAARRRFERLARSDPRLRSEIERWEGDFHRLAETVPGVEPPARVWRGIESKLGLGRARREARALRWWRALALVSSAAVLVLAIYVGLRPEAGPVVQQIAVLASEKAGAGWIVSASREDLERGRLRITALGAESLAPDRSFELWVVPEDGKPLSLGLLPAKGSIVLAARGDAVARLAGGRTLAVSVEPRGGSPTGAPTGPVISAGKIRLL